MFSGGTTLDVLFSWETSLSSEVEGQANERTKRYTA